MNIKKIIEEEIAKQSESFDFKPNELKSFINELFSFSTSKLLKNLGNQDEILDTKNELPSEFWGNLIDTINESYGEYSEDWEREFKKVKLQILCCKYFTKKELSNLEELEKKIRVDIKKYFSSLQNYVDNENFKDRFFNLPIGLLTDFTRYILNKSEALNKKIKLTKEDFKEEVIRLKKERKKVIKKISFISNSNISILDLKEVKNIIDNGVFYEDNLLNRGVCEYIYKLVNHQDASEKIIDEFNATFLNDLKNSIETSNSYLNHTTAIKNEESPEYFSVGGTQIGRRFDNEIDALDNKKDPEAVIDKDSIFKEPKGRIKSTFDWEGADETGSIEKTGEDAKGDMGSGSGIGGGGGFSGGGGDSFSGPTGGAETVDLDVPNEDGSMPDAGGEEGMPPGEDGLPVDFGTPESNETDVESTNTEKPKENNKELTNK